MERPVCKAKYAQTDKKSTLGSHSHAESKNTTSYKERIDVVSEWVGGMKVVKTYKLPTII